MQKSGRFNFYIYWIAFVACLGGILQSYVTCIIAGSLLFISNEFHLTSLQEGNLASFILIGAILGSLSSGYLADRFGRRALLIVSSAIYFITAVASFAIFSFGSLMVLRFFTGLAVGITSMLIPMYLAEISPSEKRGAFVTGYQLSVVAGTLVAYFINFLYTTSQDWKMMFIIAAFPAVMQICAFFFFPESPKWLVNRGKIDQAKKVLSQLGLDFSHLIVKAGQKVSQKNALFSPDFLRLIIIAIVLAVAQQLSGINAVIYFSPKIFSEAGFDTPEGAILATLLVGIVNVMATLLTIFLIDRVGRRKLLLISQTGIVVTIPIIVFALVSDTPFNDMISLGAVIAYVFFYSLGLGPIAWVLISEIFPVAVRAKALSMATFISWGSTYLVVLIFPYLIASLGPIWTFSIFAITSLAALIFFVTCIPETKGKSLEELEKQLVHRD